MNWPARWFLLSVLALVVLAWMFRFDLKPMAPDKDYVVVLDRWTGEIKAVAPGAAVSVGHAWRSTAGEKKE